MKQQLLMHGAKAAKDCADTAKETFVKGGLGKNIPVKTISNKKLSRNKYYRINFSKWFSAIKK